MHPCEDDIVCKCTTEENKVPYFNAPVYLENKEQIGKVDEIFGQLRDFVSFLLSLCQSLDLRNNMWWEKSKGQLQILLLLLKILSIP